MRFVRIKSADENDKHNNIVRKCIVSAEMKIDKCKSEYIKFVLDYIGKVNFAWLKGKAKSVKDSVVAFYNNLDKRIVKGVYAAVAGITFAAVFSANFTFAYNAFLGNTELGNVADKAFVQECIDNVNKEFSVYVSGEDIVGGKVAYVPAVIRRGTYTDAFTLEENIKSTSDVMTKAYAVEIDGSAYAAVDNKADAENILSKLADAYKTNDDTIVEFKEDVQVLYEYVPKSILLPADEAEEMLGGYKTVHNTVKAAGGMLLKDFASVNGVDVEYIKYFNGGIGKYIDGSNEILIPTRVPVITVMAYDTVSYDKTIPYEESVSEDANLYKGADKIVQKGVDGITSVTERVVRTNGAVTSQKVIRSEVKAEPVTQLRAIGTKERPNHLGTGTFVSPYGGTISSRFGRRSRGNHSGIDISGNVGDPIVAADSGTVVFSDWDGAYGKLIKIDHNNGYVTYYAHCSELYFDVGDVVQKGDIIAALGNTGRSTGPHVHFEVRYNDVVVNPLEYIER